MRRSWFLLYMRSRTRDKTHPSHKSTRFPRHPEPAQNLMLPQSAFADRQIAYGCGLRIKNVLIYLPEVAQTICIGLSGSERLQGKRLQLFKGCIIPCTLTIINNYINIILEL